VASEEKIFEAMKQVEDPELGVNVVDLGLVYGVKEEDEGKKVVLDMTLTTAACPLTDMIEGASRAALIGMDGIEDIEINWVWNPPWGPERLSEDGKMELRAMGFAI
jgi:metal-sulfur cluster biosynthetic enzyme